jgi:hypothetical protein
VVIDGSAPEKVGRRHDSREKGEPQMKRLWSLIETVAVSVALAIPLVVTIAIAQGTSPDPGPEEPRIQQRMGGERPVGDRR